MMEYLEDVHDRNMLLSVARSRKEIESGELLDVGELKEFLQLGE
jgi:hypothetical protein